MPDPKPTKAELEAAASRKDSTIESLRKRLLAGKEQMAEIGGLAVNSAITIGSGIASGYWAGRMGKNYAVLGFDASLVAGTPLLVGGFIATVMGYGNAGRYLQAAGTGFLTEATGRFAFAKGEVARAKAGGGGYGAGAAGAGGAGAGAGADEEKPKGITDRGVIYPARATSVTAAAAGRWDQQ